jgi:hypothetical protein
MDSSSSLLSSGILALQAGVCSTLARVGWSFILRMINTTSIAYPEGCMVVWVCDRLVAWESGLDEMGRSSFSLRPVTTRGLQGHR